VPFQLRRSSVQRPSASEIAALRAEYARVNCVTLPSFFDPYVVRWLQQRMRDAAWKKLVHEDLDPPAVDLLLDDPIATGVIFLMTNTPEVFETVRAITGCDDIGSYAFRVYRMDPGAGHVDTWHGDDDGNRLVTISINLGSQAFEGGALEMRDRPGGRLLHRVRNTGEGDAILFRIGPDLEHRVEEVGGTVSKYAIAGWLQRQPRHDKITARFL